MSDKVVTCSDVISYEQDAKDNVETDVTIICRICYDDDKEESVIISPCKCEGSHAHVHLSCLERWLSIKNSEHCDICNYKFQVYLSYVSIFKSLQTKISFSYFCYVITSMTLIISMLCGVIIACGLNTINGFLDDTNLGMIFNGFVMAIITFGAVYLLCLWIRICVAEWKFMTMMIRLNEDYLNTIII